MSAERCSDRHPSTLTVLPCVLDLGHDGQHFSTTGCSGSEVRWGGLTSDAPVASMGVREAREEVTTLRAELVEHALANGGCVPKPAYDDLAAEVERLRRGGATLGKVLDRTLKDALDASGRHDVIGEDGDGDWELVWETLAELRPRAERAEAERDEARAALARVEALHVAQGDGSGTNPHWCSGCGDAYPCPTIAAVTPPGPDAAEPDTSERS